MHPLLHRTRPRFRILDLDVCSLKGDPSDDPDFLIPISTDYICICEAAALQMEPHDEKGNSRVQFSNNSEKK